MLRMMVTLWLGALGVSSVGFLALVIIQRAVDLVRPRREDAPVAVPTPLVVRAEQALQVPEPLAG